MQPRTQKRKFDLPVKRVKGETVEEKLTENIHHRILPARYLEKNKEAEVLETPKKISGRVTKNDSDYV